MDAVDALDDGLMVLVRDMDQLDAIMPQLLVQFPQMISVMQSMRTSVLTMYATMSGHKTIRSSCLQRCSRTRTSSAR
ncbi:Putative membrane protein, MmpL [Mycobacteroides abscessus subsp. massiliense]|nr:Putative membrane protein, MmpL [Mycobacteroides abscessus subsp. massiliense]